MKQTQAEEQVAREQRQAAELARRAQSAFATGVPPNIYAFHRYTRNSANLYFTQDEQSCSRVTWSCWTRRIGKSPR